MKLKSGFLRRRDFRTDSEAFLPWCRVTRDAYESGLDRASERAELSESRGAEWPLALCIGVPTRNCASTK